MTTTFAGMVLVHFVDLSSTNRLWVFSSPVDAVVVAIVETFVSFTCTYIAVYCDAVGIGPTHRDNHDRVRIYL